MAEPTSFEKALRKALGEVIRSRRKAAGLTPTQAVKLLHDPIAPRTLAGYENGERAVSVPRLADLAQAFGYAAPEMLAHAMLKAGLSPFHPLRRRT